MLEVRDLSVSFPSGASALTGVRLDVRAGELVALSGEPGSGKSALVSCVAGDLLPSRGRVVVGGRAIYPNRRAGRRGVRFRQLIEPDDVAVVWQDLVVCDALDVAANLMLGRETHIRSDARFYAAAARELRELEIPIADVTVPVSRISLAQQRLLTLASALGHKPRLLIVDELTSSLGAEASAVAERLLVSAQRQGMAVLLVTRDIEQMFRIADRIVVLAHGQVAAEFDPANSNREDVAGLLGEEAAIAHREAVALRRSQELQRQFLSRLSHELRTPLTAIHGYATSLAAPDVIWDPASEQRFLERIAAESGRLGRLVRDMLDFSAIESGVMRLQPDWCELELIIKAAVAVLPADWSGSVAVCCDVDAPAIWADHDRLEQVFLNLLFNAFRHNDAGVHVTVKGREVQPGTVEITVSDDGAGFPQELQGDPFDSERPRSPTAGAGLGLGIAKGIIEAHGGTIELARGSQGAEFKLTLPVEEPGATPRPHPDSSATADADTLHTHA
jgi:signal transduction histidine kinase